MTGTMLKAVRKSDWQIQSVSETNSGSQGSEEKTPPQEPQAVPAILPRPSVTVSASTVPAAPVTPPAALVLPVTTPPAPILALPAPDKAELDKKEAPSADGCRAKELPSTRVAPTMAAPATAEQTDAATTQPKIEHLATGCLVVATLAVLTKIAFGKPS